MSIPSIVYCELDKPEIQVISPEHQSYMLRTYNLQLWVNCKKHCAIPQEDESQRMARELFMLENSRNYMLMYKYAE